MQPARQSWWEDPLLLSAAPGPVRFDTQREEGSPDRWWDDPLMDAAASAAPPRREGKPPPDRERLRDLTSTHNTTLNETSEQQFRAWIAQENARQKRDLMRDLGDYDVRGFWAAGFRPDERNHGTDRYKKPSHPTFSQESVYARPTEGKPSAAGRWEDREGKPHFIAGPENRRYWSKEALTRYFQREEPHVTLIYDEEQK